MKFSKNDYRTTVWSGGTTTEMLIYPKNAEYEKRQFIYRISSAKVDLETSSFTKLPGIERKLMILQGDMSLSHNGTPFCALPHFTEHGFSGAWDTKSIGRCVDFNLMLKDGAQGDIEALTYKKLFDKDVLRGVSAKEKDAYPECFLHYQADHVFFYMYQGSCRLEATNIWKSMKEENREEDEVVLDVQDSYLVKSTQGKVNVIIKNMSKDAICIVCKIVLAKRQKI